MAGNPDEYFWQHREQAWFERRPEGTYEEYVNTVLEEGTSANGVFGVKFFSGEYFRHLTRRLRLLPKYRDRKLSVCELLSGTFPNLHYVWITRRNKVRQAVSWWRAIQTHAWRSWNEPRVQLRELEYDFEQIDTLLQAILAREGAWQSHFERCGVRPFTVVYEDFSRASELTVRETLNYLKITAPERLDLNARRMKKQADELSEQWVKQYYAQRRI